MCLIPNQNVFKNVAISPNAIPFSEPFILQAIFQILQVILSKFKLNQVSSHVTDSYDSSSQDPFQFRTLFFFKKKKYSAKGNQMVCACTIQ